MGKEETAEAAVLDYLTKQNRPYSVNDIVSNLHKEHGKTAVQKAVDNLVQVLLIFVQDHRVNFVCMFVVDG